MVMVKIVYCYGLYGDDPRTKLTYGKNEMHWEIFHLSGNLFWLEIKISRVITTDPNTLNNEHIHWLFTEVRFVNNFTPQDFQAKDFTPLISLNLNSFSDKNT